MKVVVTLVAVTVLAALAPAVANADGDPASDYLLVQNVFLPFDVKIPAAKGNQLAQLVANAKRAGFRIRVAVIGTRYDLGSVPVLYGKPQRYAEFLGMEIRFVYHGRLLVVMPNGFGYSVAGKPAPAGALAGLAPPGRDAVRLVDGAMTALRRLAAADGVHLAVPRVKPAQSENRDRIIIAAAVLTGGGVFCAWFVFRRLRAARAT
jgi:hypothetical protein